MKNELLESILAAIKAGIKIEFYKDNHVLNAVMVNMIKKDKRGTVSSGYVFTKEELENKNIMPIKYFIDKNINILNEK